jgi:hypothetical protein
MRPTRCHTIRTAKSVLRLESDGLRSEIDRSPNRRLSFPIDRPPQQAGQFHIWFPRWLELANKPTTSISRCKTPQRNGRISRFRIAMLVAWQKWPKLKSLRPSRRQLLSSARLNLRDVIWMSRESNPRPVLIERPRRVAGRESNC